MTHYDTLGISLDATFDEIKDAYRQKLLIVHPDKQSTANTDYLESSDSFLQLRSAWNILSDVSLRQEYDLILRVQRSKVERLGLEEVTTADSTTKYPVNFTCTCSTIITVQKEDFEDATEIQLQCENCSKYVFVHRPAK